MGFGETDDGVSDIFEQYGVEDVRDLIREYPLAWVGGEGMRAEQYSLLPLLGEYDEAGSLICLVGHMARRNPLFAGLSQSSRATILFSGPSSYVSPEHAGSRTWAPTWNYAQLRVETEILFEPDRTEAALDMLTDAVADGSGWRKEELGPRYAAMLDAIVGFRATVTKVTGKFKLGQDEKPETLRAILANHPDQDLVQWMRRFNRGRA